MVLLAGAGFAQTLEVRTAKVVAGCLEKGLCGQEYEVGMESAMASARALRRTMTMTGSIDYITVDVEVESAGEGEAVVRTQRAFSRVVRQPDGAGRRRTTTVTFREQWQKIDEQWTLRSFVELDASARWDYDRRRLQARF
jgi:hypothetical protein